MYDDYPVDPLEEHNAFTYSTAAELDAEEARIYGEAHPEIPWINTSSDAWHRNPYYTGPEVPHPEEYIDDDEGQPTEYEEWQDYMGGDDWDHGQYDF